MTAAPEVMPPRPLRLWPAIVIVALQWLVRFGVPAVKPEAVLIGVLGGLVGWLALVIWWLFFSRAAWADRLIGLALMIGAVLVTRPFLHPSLAGGMMGMMFAIYVPATLSLGFVAGLAATRRLAKGARYGALAACLLVGTGVWSLLRTNGITADAQSDFRWRWSPTAEERLLASAKAEPSAPATPPRAAPTPAVPVSEAAPAAAPAVPAAPGTAAGDPVAQPAPVASPPAAAEWPGFRGPGRDGIARGVRIATDWAASPPVELWRRAVGPGWSSFAVQGDRFFTQEQRGDDEVVACYRVSTGEPVWKHRDPVRFWESNAGPGPRATPTLSNGRVYALGATGLVNALDAGTGAVVWSRDAAKDTGAKTPGWGFAGSPVVADDVVVVATAGALVGYDAKTGDLRWKGPADAGGYSSPQLATIDAVPQVVLLTTKGVLGVAPRDGAVLWEHSYGGDGIVQPGFTPDGNVLLGSGSGMGGNTGMRRIAVANSAGGWTVAERWTTAGLKPYFNDFVVHDGHAYGVDGTILACVDLADGARKWKGGRYGAGQLVLLPDQSALLVLSEQGEIALVSATPDKFTELARFPAIEGKTWNHPVVVGDVLLARNDQEMAAFRLPKAPR
jgi:outer membrane protein assembly factor BamB